MADVKIEGLATKGNKVQVFRGDYIVVSNTFVYVVMYEYSTVNILNCRIVDITSGLYTIIKNATPNILYLDDIQLEFFDSSITLIRGRDADITFKIKGAN